MRENFLVLYFLFIMCSPNDSQHSAFMKHYPTVNLCELASLMMEIIHG